MASRQSTQAESDVLVAGGGPAGIAAAIAAARAGAKTTLIETHGCLGGVWTAGQLAWVFEGANSGIVSEIANALSAMGARRQEPTTSAYSYDVEAMKVLCERLCIEAGVRIRLQTRVVDAVVEDGRIRQAVTESKSGREHWPSKAFIDCSGDGDFGSFAGCSFDLGGPNGEIQPCTLMAIISVGDLKAIKEFVSFIDGNPWQRHEESIKAFLGEMDKLGIKLSYMRPTIFHLRDNLCALMANHEYKVSAIDADSVTQATLRARQELWQLVEGLRSLGGKWSGVAIASTAEQIGIREARRLHGLYTVSDDDLRNGASFDDAVCRCSFGVDVHSCDPAKDKGLSNMGFRSKPYQIPYRSLVAKDVKGLLMAGRCISGGWLPHASYRVTGTAAALGEAAGKAAAFSARTGRLPHELRWSEIAGV